MLKLINLFQEGNVYFISSFYDWWHLVKYGEYAGIHPHGQQVFFTYLGRCESDAEDQWENYMNREVYFNYD